MLATIQYTLTSKVNFQMANPPQQSAAADPSVGDDHPKQTPNGAQSAATSHGQAPPAASATGPKLKKAAKAKKAPDASETTKLLAAKINQLELDAAGEKDQEQEIGKWKLPHTPSIRRWSSMLSYMLHVWQVC